MNFEIKTEDLKFINEQLKLNEVGYAELFKRFYAGKIYIINLTKEIGYIWNDEIKLYEEVSQTKITPIISKVLQKVIHFVIDQVKINDILDDKEKQKKIKFYDSIISKFGSLSSTRNIYKFILSKYEDKSKITQFGNVKNILPVKNFKVINLQTGILEDRTHNHYFTYELDYEYLGKGDDKSPKPSNFLCN